jgi:hypothetical protein
VERIGGRWKDLAVFENRGMIRPPNNALKSVTMPKRSKILTDLRRATLEVKKWMEKNPQLDVMDQIFIENDIQMLQMTYASWKSRNTLRAVS